MKLSALYLFLFFSIPCVAAENISKFGKVISFDLPTNQWKKVEDQSNELKGMVMFKHSPIKDNTGLVVEPVLSIVYEKTSPEIENIDDYVKYARGKTQFKVEKAISLENGTVVFFCSYVVQGVSHSLIIGHLYKDGVGVQAIADTTVSLLEKLNDQQKLFISSVQIKNG